VVAVAFALAGAAVTYAIRALSPSGEGPAPEATDPLASIAPGWTELPASAQQLRGTPVWTGRELLVVGGYDEGSEAPTAGGFAFDPVSLAWRPISPAPAARSGLRAVWTGSEALFLFGWDDERERADGFAFDPESETWRRIAPAPVDPPVAVTVWTGSEVVAWGGAEGEGAAYDPASDTWRRIPDAPLGLNRASGVWTGEELIVFGSLLDRRNHAETPTSVGAAYDPARDRWRELPPSELSPQATAAVWVDGRMVAYDYALDAQAYDPAADRWSGLPRLPLRKAECYPDAAVVGTRIFAFYCGTGAVLDEAGEWREIRDGMLDATIEAHGSAYQLWRFASLVPAGDVLFLLAEGITVDEDGVPCYGCAGSPHSLWAYRPAA
jgi:hypothetical protein